MQLDCPRGHPMVYFEATFVSGVLQVNVNLTLSMLNLIREDS